MVCIIPSGAVSGPPYSFNQQYCLPLIVGKQSLGQSTEGETSRKVDRQCCKIKPRLRPLAIRAQGSRRQRGSSQGSTGGAAHGPPKLPMFAVHTRPKPPGDDARGLGARLNSGGGRSSLLFGRPKYQFFGWSFWVSPPGVSVVGAAPSTDGAGVAPGSAAPSAGAGGAAAGAAAVMMRA
jgi:hypothetical protein